MKKFQDKNFNYQYLKREHPTSELNYLHMHGFYEIYYFLEGDASYNIDGDTYKLSYGDLLFIPPSTYHSFVLNSSIPYTRQVIHFSAEFISNSILELTKSSAGIYSIPNNNVINTLFKTLYESEKFLDDECMTILIKNSLEIILSQLSCMNSSHTERISSSNQLLNSLLKYIDDHIFDNITINDLAKFSYLSPSYISHMFQNKLLISVQKYISRKKMSYAQFLIGGGSRPTDIALQLGYENYSTFYRLYKKFNNESPQNNKENTIHSQELLD